MKATRKHKPSKPFIFELFARLTPEQQRLVTGVAASLVATNERRKEQAKGGAA